MPYYETIYEDGTSGVAHAESDEKYLVGATEAHRRAKAGEPAITPAPGEPKMRAVRIVRILRYDEHPASLYEDGKVNATLVKERLEEAVTALADDDNMVSVPALVADTRAISDPHVVKESPHDSRYEMAESGELNPKDWGGE